MNQLKATVTLYSALILIGLLSSCLGSDPSDSPFTPESTKEPPITQIAPTTSPAPVESATAIERETIGTEAANADVLHVRAVLIEQGGWTFHVTVEHPDTGWDDYADGWDVVLPDGTVVKPNADSPFTRLLLHPHQNEQPFVRSQTGIIIPADVTTVRVRAHDLVDGFGGAEVVVDLTASSGPGFVVEN